MTVDLHSGVTDGQKWRWEDEYEVHYICKLHCKRYTQIGSDEFVFIFYQFSVKRCKAVTNAPLYNHTNLPVA